MTDPETYEGYKNRETWAFEVNWANTQPLYYWVLGTAQDFLRHKPDAEDYEIGRRIIEAVQDLYRERVDQETISDRSVWETPDPAAEEMRRALKVMRNDVGSWWRVDEAEVGASIRDSLKQEDMLS